MIFYKHAPVRLIRTQTQKREYNIGSSFNFLLNASKEDKGASLLKEVILHLYKENRLGVYLYLTATGILFFFINKKNANTCFNKNVKHVVF